MEHFATIISTLVMATSVSTFAGGLQVTEEFTRK